MIPREEDMDSRYTMTEDSVVLDLGIKTYIILS